MPTNWAIGGTALSTWCDNVRIMPERSPALRGRNPVMPFQDGELDQLRRRFGAYDLVLETLVKSSPDFYTNQEELMKLIMDTTATVWLQRDLESGNNVEIPVRPLQVVTTGTGAERFRLRWLLRTIDPLWRNRTQTTGDTTPVTNNGSAPVGDAVITFTAGTTTRMTHTESGDWIQVDGAATNVIVDVGLRTVTLSAANHDANFSAKEPWWIRLEPGNNNFTFTGSGAASFDFYDKFF